MPKPTGYLTPWEAMLEFSGQVQPGSPVEMSAIYVAAPALPVRRRITVEEFEGDMRAARRVLP